MCSDQWHRGRQRRATAWGRRLPVGDGVVFERGFGVNKCTGWQVEIQFAVNSIGAAIGTDVQWATCAPHEMLKVGIVADDLEMNLVHFAIQIARLTDLGLAVDRPVYSYGREDVLQVHEDRVKGHAGRNVIRVGANFGIVADHHTAVRGPAVIVVERMVGKCAINLGGFAYIDHGAVGNGAYRQAVSVASRGFEVDTAMPAEG